MMVMAKSTMGGTITQNFVQNGMFSLLFKLGHYREKHKRKQQKFVQWGLEDGTRKRSLFR